MPLECDKKQSAEFALYCLKNNINMMKLTKADILKIEAEWLKNRIEKGKDDEKI